MIADDDASRTRILADRSCRIQLKKYGLNVDMHINRTA